MVYYVRPGTTNPSYGVYIQDTDGYFLTVDEWNSATGLSVKGVAVITDEHSFVIAKNDASSDKRWGGSGTEVSGIVTTESNSTAAQDYDGEENTEVIIAALEGVNDGQVDGAPAAEACVNQILPSYKYKGYMGSAGEWNIVLQNQSEIIAAMVAISGSSVGVGTYWTSTQIDADSAWSVDLQYGVLRGAPKSSIFGARAFMAL